MARRQTHIFNEWKSSIFSRSCGNVKTNWWGTAVLRLIKGLINVL